MHVYKSNVKRAVMFEWLNVEMPLQKVVTN